MINIPVCQVLYSIFCSVKVFELFPPQLLFNIKISLLQKEYDKKDGTEVWVDKATFYIGPNKRKIVAPSFQVSTFLLKFCYVI